MKKRILLILVVLAISLPFVPVTAQVDLAPGPGVGDVTPKEKDKYELTSTHSNYKVNVDISGSPSARIYKWEEEIYIDVSYPSVALSPMRNLEDNKVTWRDGDVEIHQYLVGPTEQFEGGIFEFEVILHSKPVSNKIVLDIETKGLVFYYQPTLTQQEIDNGAQRPDNVVGSYAVYHESKRDNKYKTGKAFHIPRPQPIDADGSTVWADMLIENGQMTITIPQKFLDEAKYPIRHATGLRFGNTVAGLSADSLENQIRGLVTTGAFGTGISISAYIEVFTAAKDTKAALYDGSDNLVTNGETDETLVATGAAHWETFNFTLAPTLSAVTYWIAAWSESAGGGNLLYYDAGDAGDGREDAEAYNGWPNPATGSSNNHKRSIYVTYKLRRILNISVDGKVLISP